MLAALVAHLRAHPGLSALVGQRIYFKRLPATPQYPCIVYQRISEQRGYTHSGPDRLPAMRVQFVAWDTDPVRVLAVQQALIAALESCNLGGPTTIETVFDRPDDIKTPQGQRVEGVQVDAVIPYRE